MFHDDKIVEEITNFIRNWVKLLSEQKFETACNILDKPQDILSEITWSPDVLKEVMNEYFAEEGFPVFNDPLLMNIEGECIDFYKYNSGEGYAVDYLLPINGEWSDFTAQFSFKSKSPNEYTVLLEDIHVL